MVVEFCHGGGLFRGEAEMALLFVQLKSQHHDDRDQSCYAIRKQARDDNAAFVSHQGQVHCDSGYENGDSADHRKPEIAHPLAHTPLLLPLDEMQVNQGGIGKRQQNC
jgi:hypothetical protein